VGDTTRRVEKVTEFLGGAIDEATEYLRESSSSILEAIESLLETRYDWRLSIGGGGGNGDSQAGLPMFATEGGPSVTVAKGGEKSAPQKSEIANRLSRWGVDRKTSAKA
jgi:hypothetical protein